LGGVTLTVIALACAVLFALFPGAFAKTGTFITGHWLAILALVVLATALGLAFLRGRQVGKDQARRAPTVISSNENSSIIKQPRRWEKIISVHCSHIENPPLCYKPKKGGHVFPGVGLEFLNFAVPDGCNIEHDHYQTTWDKVIADIKEKKVDTCLSPL